MPAPGIARILNALERHYGAQQVSWPTDPYEFIVWWHCGYPASQARCAKGWESLRANLGSGIGDILRAPLPQLMEALTPGGMVPDLRARRLREVAARVRDEFAGDLRAGLEGSITEARKRLRSFPNIAGPGSDRILLFANLWPVAAVPSNCPHVLVRIVQGQERHGYAVTYREAQETIEGGTPATYAARQRAYLLVQHHAAIMCKASKPLCAECPVSANCTYNRGATRGRAVFYH